MSPCGNLKMVPRRELECSVDRASCMSCVYSWRFRPSLGTRTDRQLPLSMNQGTETSTGAPRFNTMDRLRCPWRDTMADGPYAVKRTNPRFSFFADAEVTLRDGTGVHAQVAELSSRGCYIDTLEPIPSHTRFHLRIS